jgi:hypothetical protein
MAMGRTEDDRSRMENHGKPDVYVYYGFGAK